MRTINFIFISLLALMVFSTSRASAQNFPDTAKIKSSKTFVITKNDGTEFVGIIISQDAREVLIDTEKMGQVIIPKHEIREIREIKKGEISAGGEYLPAEVFSTRYFLTSNGLPIEKGESYILWNLYGPDFQFGIGKNFGVGVMTSWFAVPLIGSAKYSLELNKNVSLGLGILLGTGSWANPDFGLALPFGSLTFGDRRKNLTFSSGYGTVWSKGKNEGRLLLSVAGMSKVGNKVSLVFDSFIFPSSGNSGGALLLPGIRLQTENKKAFQFGFGALVANGKLIPMPIPVVQWFKKL
jgi:hypothetical protein